MQLREIRIYKAPNIETSEKTEVGMFTISSGQMTHVWQSLGSVRSDLSDNNRQIENRVKSGHLFQ